jgi:hypothetical protein
MSITPGVTENKSINITFTIECIEVDETDQQKPLDWNGATASLKITGYKESPLSPSMASFNNKKYIYLGENFIEMDSNDKNKIIAIFEKERDLPFIDNKENPRTQHVLEKIEDFINKMDENTKDLIEKGIKTAGGEGATESHQLTKILELLKQPNAQQKQQVGGKGEPGVPLTKTRRPKIRGGKKKRRTRRYYYK